MAHNIRHGLRRTPGSALPDLVACSCPQCSTRPTTCTTPDGTGVGPGYTYDTLSRDQAFCVTCTCGDDGLFVCTDRVDCPALDCEFPVMVEGECCPQCQTSRPICTTPDGTEVQPGFSYETYNMDGNSCTTCSCVLDRSGRANWVCPIEGNVMCPQLNCPGFEVMTEEDCCPQCSGGDGDAPCEGDALTTMASVRPGSQVTSYTYARAREAGVWFRPCDDNRACVQRLRMGKSTVRRFA